MEPFTVLIISTALFFGSLFGGLLLSFVKAYKKRLSSVRFLKQKIENIDASDPEEVPIERSAVYLDEDMLAILRTLNSLLRTANENLQKQREAESILVESEKNYRSIFDNASLGIFQSTPDGKILRVNNAFAEMLGFKKSEIVGLDRKTIFDFFADEEKIDQFFQLLATNKKIQSFEAVWYGREQEKIYVSISAHLATELRTGQMIYEGLVDNITERKRNWNKERLSVNFLQ